MQKKFQIVLSLITGLVSLAIAIYLSTPMENVSPTNEEYNQFLEERQTLLSSYLDRYQEEKNRLSDQYPDFQQLYDRSGISFFEAEGDTLKYWSENQSVVSLASLQEEGAVLLNGDAAYLKVSSTQDSTTLYALERIARSYPYQNRYLKTELNKAWTPYLAILQSNFPEEQLLQEFVIEPWTEPNFRSRVFSFLLFLLFCASLIYAVPLVLSNENYRASLRIVLLLLLRLWLFYFDPLQWKSLALFDPAEFAISHAIPSIADLFLHVLTFFLISYQLSLMRGNRNKLSFALSALLFMGLNFVSLSLIEQSVVNSQFNYTLDNIFKLDHLSYIGLFSFGFLYLTSFIYLKLIFHHLVAFQKKHSGYLSLLILLIVFIALTYSSGVSWSFVLLSLAMLFIYALYQFQFRLPDLIYSFSLLFLVAIASSLAIDTGVRSKEERSQLIVLQKLAEERDPLMEFLFQDIQSKIRKDQKLVELAENRWQDQVAYIDYLRKSYFNGYWDRYRINYTICTAIDSIMIGGNTQNQNCVDYFHSRIYREGDQISSTNLFRLSNLAGRIDYIGELKLDSEEGFILYLEFSRDYFSEDLGYPELFLNEEDKQLHLKLDDYSYAVYFQEELINSEGSYVYPVRMKNAASDSSAIHTYRYGGFKHSVYTKNENIKILLSLKDPSALEYLSRITYLLVLFGVLFLLLSLALRNFPFYRKLIITDFSTKIRLLIGSSLLFAFLLFLAGTSYYIKEQYEEKNARAIEEKLRSISLELFQKLGTVEELNGDIEPYVTSLLIKFSNVFYTDINLYGSNGELYASSRPELYQQGLKSRRMNTMAYQEIIGEGKSKLVQQESIGKLGYQSAYIPFKNQENVVLAYLNLPYFARQEEFEEEISAFLVPTINSYVIIFTLAFFLSFLLIDQITRPLLLIRNYISNLKLGERTELIDWKSSDEIGELVNEYNRIAIELGQSAEELAKTERESAWREMAKQIAHEIKNPLTPMKLSIQHLKRSSEDGQDLQEKISKTSDTLISQIDLLSSIAEAFSAFAKFPEKELEDFDIHPVIEEVSHLYVDQADIEIHTMPGDPVPIRAEKDIVLRIFNNLIKNSVQAAKDDKNVRILIRSQIVEDRLVVEIEDDGKGIESELLSRIFEPSFTTKSSGTGLGLAIVKRSIEQIGGKVELKSEIGKGSTFYLHFPIA